MSNILYVYGTLRPGKKEDTVTVKGTMYDLGWFPGIKLGGDADVLCEKITVDDWDRVDRYEGYIPGNEEESLYIRRPFADGYIYEFNRDVNPVKQVKSGDWLDYTKKDKGRYGGGF